MNQQERNKKVINDIGKGIRQQHSFIKDIISDLPEKQKKQAAELFRQAKSGHVDLSSLRKFLKDAGQRESAMDNFYKDKQEEEQRFKETLSNIKIDR